MKRLYEIDLLRIIAALAVVIFHYTFSGWMQGLSPVSFPGSARCPGTAISAWTSSL